jgi:fluoride ion exporter CrcB/FEX
VRAAVSNVALSLGLGLVAVWIGIVTGRAVWS